MNTYTVLLHALCCVGSVVLAASMDGHQQDQNATLAENGNITDEEVLLEEKMKKLRIDMIKFQILSNLNLKEAPPSVQPPSEATRDMIRLLVKEEEEMQRQRYRVFDSEERLLIHAKNNRIPCVQSNVSYCKMFQFELNPALNTSAVDILIYKLTENPSGISISISFFSSNDEKYYDILYYELHQVGWNKLQLPRLWLPSAWNETVSYSVEISGQNFEDHGDHRPFLMVSRSPSIPSRQRREVACDTNENCCFKPYRVSFAAIGFDWVVYPLEFDANMCTGKCRRDYHAMRTHYERAMTKAMETNSNLNESLGECWTLCCKPKEIDSVRVIYNDTSGTVHDQHIPELSVKSCGCS